ncbi:MAG: hypothetical protein K8I30_20005 [Anaerolineae bacterium]|nr:hypothetical protein [Anaerolineae bacterium]
MAIEVFWGNPEQTIVCSRFGEMWTLEDTHQMIDDMHALTSSVTHTVHTILDFTDSRVSPTRLLSSGNHIEKRSVPNSGISVIVKANGFVKAMAQLITKMFIKDVKVFFVDSLDDAYNIIEQYEAAHVKG